METEITIKTKDGIEIKKKYGSQEKYDKENTLRVAIKLNKKTDADIIEWLETQENKQGAIKRIIREYMNNTK